MGRRFLFVLLASISFYGCPIGGSSGSSGGGASGGVGPSPPGDTGEEANSLLENPLSAICQTLSGVFYMASNGGKPLVYSDGLAVSVLEGTNLDLNGVACDRNSNVSTSVWFAGDGGTIIFYDGSVLTEQPSGTTEELNDISEITTDNVVAVGDSGTILRFSGSTWASQTNMDTDANDLFGVHVVSSAVGFAVGANKTFLSFSSAAWQDESGLLPSSVLADTQLNDVWATATGGEVFVVGDSGTILHRNGSIWEVQESGTSQDLLSVHGAANNMVLAVGEGGVILSYDGTSWTQQTNPLEDPFIFTGALAISNSSAFIVGAETASSTATGAVLGFVASGWAQLL